MKALFKIHEGIFFQPPALLFGEDVHDKSSGTVLFQRQFNIVHVSISIRNRSKYNYLTIQ